MAIKSWRKKAWDSFHSGSKFALKHHNLIAHGAKVLHKTFNNTKGFSNWNADMAGPSTTQNDAVVIYRKKKRSRSSKRKANFANRVQKALATTYAKKKLCLMRTWNNTTSPGTQAFNAISMYGWGVSDADVWDMFEAQQATVNRNWRFLAESCHTDFLATNTTLGGASNIILKVYTCAYRKDMPFTFGTNLGNFWINSILENFDFGGGSIIGQDNIVAEQSVGSIPPLSPSVPGQTPFDSPTFCQRVKILKVVEFNIQPGQTVSWNRDSKKTGMLHENFFGQGAPTPPNTINMGVWATPKWTTTELLVYHGVPRAPAASTLAGFYPAASLCLVANKTYNFCEVTTQDADTIREVRTIA